MTKNHVPMLHRWLEAATLGIASAVFLTGFMSFLHWFVPAFAKGILPAAFVNMFLRATWLASTGWTILHLVSALALLAMIGWGAVEWRKGIIRPSFLDAGPLTATGALLQWGGGLFKPRREERLHFRDMLLLPRVELAGSIAIGIATAPLIWVPWTFVSHMALALHRVNAVVFLCLITYLATAVLLGRRGDSPHRAVIRDGRIVVRKARFEDESEARAQVASR